MAPSVAYITAREVRRWFASLHQTAVVADRTVPILPVIMCQAEVYGYRPEGTNPCAGSRRYRRQGRERFLSTTEMLRRRGEVQARHYANPPQTAAFILLLLTRRRIGEIITLK